jgi:hypothetical protein
MGQYEGDVLHFCDDVWNPAFITLAEAGSFKAIYSAVELTQNLQIFFDSREDFVPCGGRQAGGFNSVQLGHV